MLISIHIPKTGGTTFQTLLENAFGSGCFFDYAANPTKKGYFRDVCDAYLFRFSKSQPPSSTRCIHGHFFALKYTHVREAQFATWVRNPLQLVPSLYFFWKRHPEVADRHPLCKRMHQDNMTLEEFAALPHLWNIQTKFLTGVSIRRLHFVGLTEEYEKGVHLFKKTFTLSDRVYFATMNSNPEKRSEYQLSSKLKSDLSRWNSKDMSLYEKGRLRFVELCRKYNV